MNCRLKLKVILASVFIASATGVSAQWQVGIKSGVSITSTDRSQSGRVDETYSSRAGWRAEAMAEYAFNEWFGLGVGINLMERSHRMDRNIRYLDPVYTISHNTYMMIPVTTDFSFGGSRLRGHMYAGCFTGYRLKASREGTTYWMTDYNIYFEPFDEEMESSSEEQRFTAGLAGGVGLSYLFTDHWGVLLDAVYYYDMVSYRKSSKHLSDPRYLNSLAVSLGVTYKF